jgi:two-component system, OmpR family, phosphate regulon sensor histidine kinase PhoR
MYSLRLQLFFSAFISAVGGVVAMYFFHFSTTLSVIIFLFSIILSCVVLYFFVYRQLQKIQIVIDAQKDKNSVHRALADSSDEMQKLSDAINSMLDSFRADIAQMKKLEKVRSEFLGNVSHELRTPIFSTQGLLETLLNGAVNDKKVNKEFLRKALNNIARLNSLLADLIDISRIQSGEMKLSFRFFDLVDFLTSIINELQTTADKRKISLSLSGDTKKLIEVYGDKERLHQVMLNLIENAIKYSEAKDKIVVRYKEFNDEVEISVEDTGIGIAPQHLPRIFERFYRIDRDRSRDVGGTGLGLAIVKHIVEAHQSSIKVESEIGIGTKFSFVVKKKMNA